MLKRPEHYNYVFYFFLFTTLALLPHWSFHLSAASLAERDVFAVADLMAGKGQWSLPDSAIQKWTILPYWLATAGHFIFPEGLFGYRILFILISIGFLARWYTFLSEYLGTQTASFSISILLACGPLTFFFFQANPFSLVTLFIASSLFSFFAWLKKKEQFSLWSFYVSLALTTITGGPLLLLLTCIIMVVYLMFKIKMNERMLASIKAGKGLSAVILFSLLCWFIAFGGIKNFSLQRLFSAEVPETSFTGEAFYFPFLFLLVLLLPFSGFLPKAFSTAWRLKVRKDLFMMSSLALLIILLWCVVVEESSIQQILPAAPFAVMAIGLLFSQQAGRNWNKMGVYFGSGTLLLIVSALIAGVFWFLPELEEYSWLAYSGAVVLFSGTITCFMFWAKKKTDYGLFILCFSFLLFSACFMEVFRYQPSLLMELARLW